MKRTFKSNALFVDFNKVFAWFVYESFALLTIK